MISKKFDRLCVVQLEYTDAKYQKYWRCKCDCGNETIARQDKLTSGSKRSCGCLATSYRTQLQVEASTEARRYTRNSYKAMISRCYRESMGSYKKYGAKGITVCDRWRSGDGSNNGWTCFYIDMGPRPKGTSIDRIDNTKGYSPENCRWATVHQQNQNRKRQT
jgi:hypothetical protein